jgi:hypothetical protein
MDLGDQGDAREPPLAFKESKFLVADAKPPGQRGSDLADGIGAGDRDPELDCCELDSKVPDLGGADIYRRGAAGRSLAEPIEELGDTLGVVVQRTTAPCDHEETSVLTTQGGVGRELFTITSKIVDVEEAVTMDIPLLAEGGILNLELFGDLGLNWRLEDLREA